MERNYQETSAELGKLQLKYHTLEAEKNHLQVSVEELNKEKNILESKVTELEEQKITAEGKAKLYETQIAALKDEKSSLVASWKSTTEQKVYIEHLKKNSLMLRRKIHQIHL